MNKVYITEYSPTKHRNVLKSSQTQQRFARRVDNKVFLTIYGHRDNLLNINARYLNSTE